MEVVVFMQHSIKQCKFCGKKFKNIEGRIFSNHVRWCIKNTTNGDKGRKSNSIGTKIRYEKEYGKKIILEKKCKECGTLFNIIIREKKSYKYLKTFCSKACSNKFRSKDKQFQSKIKKAISSGIKQKWQDKEYATKVLNSQSQTNKRFSSKGEREIRQHFQQKFKNDHWTSGLIAHFKNTRLTSDLYSKSKKIAIEYDGIWHFKNISGQLKEKQRKDKLLKEWCSKNNFKLIRIKEDIYLKNKEKTLQKIEFFINESNEQYIELY